MRARADEEGDSTGLRGRTTTHRPLGSRSATVAGMSDTTTLCTGSPPGKDVISASPWQSVVRSVPECENRASFVCVQADALLSASFSI